MRASPLLPSVPRPGPPLTQRLGSCLAEMSGTAADISLVRWRQQWLQNGTLYFHVSTSSSGQRAQATAPSLQEPSEVVEEQMHILHISVMVSEWELGGGFREWGRGGDGEGKVGSPWQEARDCQQVEGRIWLSTGGQNDKQKVRWIPRCHLD